MANKRAKKIIAWACAVVLAVAMAMSVAIYFIFPVKYEQIVIKYCNEYGVEPSVACAVIWTESKFDANAKSQAGACGLMQLMPSTASWICDNAGLSYDYESLFNPDYNIRLGVYYLSYLQRKFSGDYVYAAYNAGEGNVFTWLRRGGTIEYEETYRYVRRVNAARAVYRYRIR